MDRAAIFAICRKCQSDKGLRPCLGGQTQGGEGRQKRRNETEPIKASLQLKTLIPLAAVTPYIMIEWFYLKIWTCTARDWGMAYLGPTGQSDDAVVVVDEAVDLPQRHVSFRQLKKKPKALGVGLFCFGA